VLPVTKVDQRNVGCGSPGPITENMVKTYWRWHDDPAYSLAIDFSI
jgi:branched-chain amino acid aminotransferase